MTWIAGEVSIVDAVAQGTQLMQPSAWVRGVTLQPALLWSKGDCPTPTHTK
ncbi:hypothetical protein SAMN05192544_10332 [Paraburkholderia hospita]|jgi:hypothetical protein|nr:hypothetical protein SAMN05192544_10332 [Paraburkholderia hospita]